MPDQIEDKDVVSVVLTRGEMRDLLRVLAGQKSHNHDPLRLLLKIEAQVRVF